MTNKCIYCDPDFGEDLDDDVSSQELGGEDVDVGVFGTFSHIIYMSPKGLDAFVFDGKGKVVSEFTAPIRYCPMCGRELRDKTSSSEKPNS